MSFISKNLSALRQPELLAELLERGITAAQASDSDLSAGADLPTLGRIAKEIVPRLLSQPSNEDIREAFGTNEPGGSTVHAAVCLLEERSLVVKHGSGFKVADPFLRPVAVVGSFREGAMGLLQEVEEVKSSAVDLKFALTGFGLEREFFQPSEFLDRFFDVFERVVRNRKDLGLKTQGDVSILGPGNPDAVISRCLTRSVLAFYEDARRGDFGSNKTSSNFGPELYAEFVASLGNRDYESLVQRTISDAECLFRQHLTVASQFVRIQRACPKLNLWLNYGWVGFPVAMNVGVRAVVGFYPASTSGGEVPALNSEIGSAIYALADRELASVNRTAVRYIQYDNAVRNEASRLTTDYLSKLRSYSGFKSMTVQDSGPDLLSHSFCAKLRARIADYTDAFRSPVRIAGPRGASVERARDISD